MNPQHLIPGNYILYNGREVIVTPQLLITMQSPCKCKLFSPIELTNKWLHDFGFKNIYSGGLQLMLNQDEMIWYQDGKCYLFGIDTPNISDAICVDIKNQVHRLQILYFALTQKQLTK